MEVMVTASRGLKTLLSMPAVVSTFVDTICGHVCQYQEGTQSQTDYCKDGLVSESDHGQTV